MRQLSVDYVAFLGVFVFTLFAAIAGRKRRRFPPGPRGLPILGNIFGVPTDRPWLAYFRWSRQYKSDIVHLRLLGRHIFVVNSAAGAKEFFERRAPIYSDRPQSVMANEMSGFGRSFGSLQYGERWRMQRRLFVQHFRSTAVPKYHTKMVQEARTLLRLIFEEPIAFLTHVRHMAGALILGVVYALDIQDRDDPALAIAEETAHAFSEMIDKTYLVDLVPVLKHIPAWFPGAGFKRQAARWKRTVDTLWEGPYTTVKTAFENGNDIPCITSALLGDIDVTVKDKSSLQEMIMNITGAAYAAGADTTILSVQSFILAMVMHPEVQRTAHEELHRIVGQDRLPEFADRDSLPYISAIVKEVLRWRVPIPLGIPHQSATDDEYEGYHIPAGSVVIGNAWAILHDDARYPNPEVFDPSRFLTAEGRINPDVLDPAEAFGYGRRVCPGRYFALDAMWAAAAHILAVFEICKPLDGEGNFKDPSEGYGPGIFSFPLPFEAVFKPRFSTSEALVRSSAIAE